MCNECRRIFCAPRCPNHNGRSAARGPRRKRCSVCGQDICGDEGYAIINRLTVCEACTKSKKRNLPKAQAFIF